MRGIRDLHTYTQTQKHLSKTIQCGLYICNHTRDGAYYGYCIDYNSNYIDGEITIITFKTYFLGAQVPFCLTPFSLWMQKPWARRKA